MLTENDLAKVFDTILSIPGMNETVKIDLKISRKNVLLLNHVIERGSALEVEHKLSILLSSIPQDNLLELKQLGNEFLQKAGLIELSEKLQIFNQSSK